MRQTEKKGKRINHKKIQQENGLSGQGRPFLLCRGMGFGGQKGRNMLEYDKGKAEKLPGGGVLQREGERQ